MRFCKAVFSIFAVCADIRKQNPRDALPNPCGPPCHLFAAVPLDIYVHVKVLVLGLNIKTEI